MNALKCDRCGKYFDDDERFHTQRQYSYILVKHNKKNNKLNPFSFCIDCYKELTNWIEGENK